MKPLGNRAVLKVKIHTNKEGVEEIEQEAKVLDSNVEGVKKGDTVFFNQYGAVSVNSLKTKKDMVLIVDAEDIYGKI